jgi:hypothetical protein
MLARCLLVLFVLALPAEAADLAVTAVVAKRVQVGVQGDLLVVRSNGREGVMLDLGTTTIVVPGGVQVLRLPPGTPARITASPL